MHKPTRSYNKWWLALFIAPNGRALQRSASRHRRQSRLFNHFHRACSRPEGRALNGLWCHIWASSSGNGRAKTTSEKGLPDVPGDALGAVAVVFLFLRRPRVNLDSHRGKTMHQDCLVLFQKTKPGSCLWHTIVGSLFWWGLHH